jgi:hypothetical protein
MFSDIPPIIVADTKLLCVGRARRREEEEEEADQEEDGKVEAES